MKEIKVGHKIFSFHGTFQLPDDFLGTTADALRALADHLDAPGPVSHRFPLKFFAIYQLLDMHIDSIKEIK